MALGPRGNVRKAGPVLNLLALLVTVAMWVALLGLVALTSVGEGGSGTPGPSRP
jgi:hypothetical protein